MSTPAPDKIVRRRVKIDFDSDAIEHWFPRERQLEIFLNAASFLFPPGEEFFIYSVRRYEDRIKDSVLRNQVQRFIYQEAMHTKEHSRFNQLLVKIYPHGAWIERIVKVWLNLTRWFTPKAFRLATTCAIEHFTALSSDTLLDDQDYFIRHVQPVFAQLWMWHAVEEIEHKAVCFDVYQHVVGKGLIAYLNRVLAMIVAAPLLGLCLLIGASLLKRDLRCDLSNIRPEDQAPSAKRIAGHRSTAGVIIAIIRWRLYFDYFRPSFHPWDHNNVHLIDKWKQRFPEFGSSPSESPPYPEPTHRA